MHHISKNLKTKRGVSYPSRSTKSANGYSKVLAHHYITHSRRVPSPSSPFYPYSSEKEAILSKLSVYGTLDKLAGGGSFKFYKKLATIPHPIDPEYTKSAYVLTDSGKLRLRELRLLRQSRKSKVLYNSEV